ncbi:MULTISPECIES: YbhB/YbcL family Raf kinase inhibitor-like protein [unclassified Streptomyces]|uniref:YbhB/YbcL family Raf kinase inhibitor-like protein n=1 Tax=unclassified Streptomyces TaxID=2593676 RepID=UPI0035D82D26
MTLLGRLLNNRRAGETHTAWNLPNLQGPQSLTLTSQHFDHGGAIPLEHGAKNIGGDNLSPHLAWTPPPSDTAQLLLVMEDIDIPATKPAVHCLALIGPMHEHLEPGALNVPHPSVGVQLLRSTIGRGYHGPAPLKGHGPHRYLFQMFALATPLESSQSSKAVGRTRPRPLVAAISVPVLDRGRLAGVFER